MSAANPVPTAEQKARAEWDLLLRDLELRAEQVRQTKAYEPRRLVIQALSAAAAVFIAGAAVGGVLVSVVRAPATLTVHLDQPMRQP
jgi:hypothetical protein